MENTLDDVKRDRVVGTGLADMGRKNETQNSASSFFVGAHGVQQSFGLYAGPGWKRNERAYERNDAGNVVGSRQAQFVSKKRSGDHAPGDGFSVLVAAVLGCAFEGMGESVAEIEDFAKAGFAFIATDDAGFDLYVARNERAKCRTIAAQDLLRVFFEHRKHRCVGNDGVLDDFGEAAAKFAVWEGAQQFWIGEHEAGRIKGADEVFPFG